MKKQEYFSGKKVWLTGASSGIGFALAQHLAQLGAMLILSGRNQVALAELKEAYPEHVVLVLPFDVTEKQGYAEAAHAIKAQLGGLDIVIFNAGASENNSLSEFDSGVYERMMAVNYLSLVYGVEVALPLLQVSKTPHIVGVSSVAGYMGLPTSQAYCAAKAAARNFLQGLGAELHPAIPVTAVCPGFVETPLTAKNEFQMPFIMSADKAAAIMAEGIARRKAEVHFPYRLTWPLKCLASLPKSWSRRFVSFVFKRM